MRRKRRERVVKIGICAVYVGIILILLLSVNFGTSDTVNAWLRRAAGGVEDGPVQEAFGTLVDGLGEDRPVREVLAESYEVLTSAAD